MKVYVVFDPLYERVMSVWKYEGAASKEAWRLTEEDGRMEGHDYYFEFEEFELREDI